jgi:hypothetical protein
VRVLFFFDRTFGSCSDQLATVYLRFPAKSLRFYISDPFGLAFLYDPILLESPDTTYLVEWGEVTANQNSRTYIAKATEAHRAAYIYLCAEEGASLLTHLPVRETVGHDDVYVGEPPKQNSWHYISQQHWKIVGIKSIWPALAVPVLGLFF